MPKILGFILTFTATLFATEVAAAFSSSTKTDFSVLRRATYRSNPRSRLRARGTLSKCARTSTSKGSSSISL